MADVIVTHVKTSPVYFILVQLFLLTIIAKHKHFHLTLFYVMCRTSNPWIKRMTIQTIDANTCLKPFDNVFFFLKQSLKSLYAVMVIFE